MSEMCVSVKFSCKDKKLQNQIRDIFDLTCLNNRRDYLGLGELEGDSKWEEFYDRIESLVELNQDFSYVDSYITTLENMICEDDHVQLHYVTGAFGKEFAKEMKKLLKKLQMDEVEVSTI